MPAESRIVVSTFGRGSPRTQSWRRHVTDVTGDPTAVPEGEASVWHLSTANHRILVRAAELFTDPTAAAAAAVAIAEQASDLEPVAVRMRLSNQLGWWMRAQGKPVVVCARGYSTDRDRRNSISLAVAELGTITAVSYSRVADQRPLRRSGIETLSR